MSNALGTLAAASVVVQRALELTFSTRPLLKNISTDLSQAGAVKGQAIVSRIKSIPSVTTFGSAATDTAYTDVSVTLNTWEQVMLTFLPTEYMATQRDLVEEAAEPVAIAISNRLADAIAALWIAGNFANSTTVASGWTYVNTILPIRAAFQSRGIPDNGRRFFAFSAAVEQAFLGDSLIVAELNNARNAGAIESGVLPTVAGFGMSPYPAIPNTGNMVGFAGYPDSTIIATRIPADPRLASGVPFPGNYQVITEPKSGFSVVLNQWVDPLTRNFNHRVDFLYGVAKGNGNNGQILKTA